MTRKSPHHKGTKAQKASTGRASSRLVRQAPARSALARKAGRNRRSLSRLALRDHAPADDGDGGRAVLPRVPEALADVSSLAAADMDDVCGVWAGLGYYSRARNLHRAAQAIVRDHGGRFPRTSAELARASRYRRLHGRRDRRHRLRRAGRRDGRKRRARRRAASRGRRRAAEGQSQARCARSGAGAAPPGPAISRKR